MSEALSSGGVLVVWADATSVRAVPVAATAPRAAAPNPTLRTNRRRDGDAGAVAASTRSSTGSTGWRGLIDISRVLFGARSRRVARSAHDHHALHGVVDVAVVAVLARRGEAPGVGASFADEG